MKKKVLSILMANTMVLSLAACGSGDTTQPAANADSTPKAESSAAASSDGEAKTTSELTDGKFAETRHITVEVYD